MKIDLYIDFDGVILDTIDVTYERLRDEGISFKDTAKIISFYKKLNWDALLKECHPINDSLNNIKKLIDSDLFNVYVLSHVASDEEAFAKRNYLERRIPNLKIITIDNSINKCDAVLCKNAILVDDYMGNLELWDAKGGIAVKFSDKGKKYKFMTIDRLDMLISNYDEIMNLVK